MDRPYGIAIRYGIFVRDPLTALRTSARAGSLSWTTSTPLSVGDQLVADVATLFTVSEQLSLKMESQRGPVDVHVTDHIEKPRES